MSMAEKKVDGYVDNRTKTYDKESFHASECLEIIASWGKETEADFLKNYIHKLKSPQPPSASEMLEALREGGKWMLNKILEVGLDKGFSVSANSELLEKDLEQWLLKRGGKV